MSALAKLLPEGELAEILASHRRAGRRIVLTNGAFDLLHVGHVRALEEAATLGGVLVVAVNGDEAVRAMKGPGRPIVPARERAELVAALEGVDYVTIFDDPTVDRLLAVLRPDVHAKGRDYTPDTIPERGTSQGLGIETTIVGDAKVHSSTRLLARAAASRESIDRVLPLDLHGARGLVLRSVRRRLEASGWLDLDRLATTEEGGLVQAHRTRFVRRLEIDGTPVYLKVNRPADRKRRPRIEFENHRALRAAGFRAPEPWLALEGTTRSGTAGALLTREAPGLALDEHLALALPAAGARERHEMARGVGAALRGLHAARFYPPDLQAWHLLVEGSAAGGRRVLTFLDLMRLGRGGRRASRRRASHGLAALALSLRDVAPPRLLLAGLRAYLGGTLADARLWIRHVERRMARLEHRGTFQTAEEADRSARLRREA